MNSRRLQRISNHIAPSATAGWAAVYKTDEPQPALPHRSLRGLTLFVTGASRGIGLAIALRAARDGANIVIAAKSETEDPRLSPATVTQHVHNSHDSQDSRHYLLGGERGRSSRWPRIAHRC
jgi:hypothetical protein